jgi:hypothetical protein
VSQLLLSNALADKRLPAKPGSMISSQWEGVAAIDLSGVEGGDANRYLAGISHAGLSIAIGQRFSLRFRL